ncbi:hypothetical protein [Streptomyces sp. PTD5-9]|uniref:hypothetical protein n=1 Tax=Streptomyces sp. PTD5-9 TaxID=3120150 RepID=UPI00300971A1
MSPARGDAYQCTRCSYEISADAWHVHQVLMARLDADEAGFFDQLRRRTARLRALEPAWR